jgi:G:T-mismatch repair DNA endonuclease (very short patch repair protein)/23S rRNA maturation mini-RNase III
MPKIKSKRTLDDIVNADIKFKSLLTICERNDVSAFDVLARKKVKIYMKGLAHIGDPLYECYIRECRLCNTQFKPRQEKGHFFAHKQCACGNNGIDNLTLEKLLVYLEPENAKQALTEYNLAKTKGFKSSKRYWIANGYSEAAAEEEVRKEQARRSAMSPAAQPGAREYSVRCEEYWIARGHTQEEAKLKVAESQNHNGLDWSITTYGEEEGPIKYAERMASWNQKMAESAKTGKSKIATELFEQVDAGLGGKFNIHEEYINFNYKSYRVDYKHQNKIIEFFGTYWHADPRIYADMVVMIGDKTASDIWLRDKTKLEALANAGYDVFVVWEADYLSNKNKIIEDCKRFLGNNNEY